MRCNKGSFDMCPECDHKFIVNYETTYGSDVYYCFDSYESARAFFDIIEQSTEYEGQGIQPKTAILFHPRPEESF